MSVYHPETCFLQYILSSLPDLGYSEPLTLVPHYKPPAPSRWNRVQQVQVSSGARGCWSTFPFCPACLCDLGKPLHVAPFFICRGQYHHASFCSGCRSIREAQVLTCAMVQWYYCIKVFCTEVLRGDLKSKYMIFLWLDVFITVSQQYLMTWVTVIKALWAYLTVNVLWLFSISSPCILNSWAVSSLFIGIRTPARCAEALCRVRGTRQCLT